jgi:hypothetical protein
VALVSSAYGAVGCARRELVPHSSPSRRGVRRELSRPITERGLVYPGEPNAQGERLPIDADALRGTSCAGLAIYTHPMRRTHDDSADKIAALARSLGAGRRRGIHSDTTGSVKPD